MSALQTVYLDYNATTPCDPQVVAGMLPYFGEMYGNPANGFHMMGRAANRAVEEARDKIAALINVQTEEVVFTAGATESNNLAILGLARANTDSKRYRIITSAIEHKAVLLPCQELQQQGFEIVILPADTNGLISVAAAQEIIDEKTLLVSIQLANIEIGTLQPVSEITRYAHQHGAIVHCDAAQAVGKVSVDVQKMNIDMLSMSAHKFYGPKGVGALYVRRGAARLLKPLSFGGGQELGLRPGTLNVPAVVGFGLAAQLSHDLLIEEEKRIRQLRDKLEKFLLANIPGLIINGQHVSRLPNTSSVVFPGTETDVLLLNMPELMLGAGSACTSGTVEPSHVLQAIGLSRAAASATVRISLGRFTTEVDIDRVGQIVLQTWQRLSTG